MSKRRTTTTKKTSGSSKPKVSQDGPPEVSAKHPGAHVSQPVRNCSCWQCWMHRLAWKRDEQDHQMAAAWDRQYGHLPYEGQINFGENASAALREVLGALPVW